MKIFYAIVAALLLFAGIGYVLRDRLMPIVFAPTIDTVPLSPATPKAEDVHVVATGLKIPWGVAFLPDGSLLVTERPGTLKHLTFPNGDASASPVVTSIPLHSVKQIGEGGLLGITLHPNFKTNHWIYIDHTTSNPDGSNTNSIERYVFQNDALTDRKAIIENIPGAIYHDGGRLAFGPDGYLYITTGDSTKSNLSQDKDSLAGKILRVKDDGTIPSDNPFGTAVYTYGHRNPQGIVWDDHGNMWATEHGRSGVLSGLDEINLIQKGKNYGWPVIEGDAKKEGMVSPVIQSGPSVTWAPSGIAFYDGRLFFSGLRGEALYEAKLDGTKITSLTAHFKGTYGRIRAVELGPDGYLYITTSNTDGRGTPKEGDDKLIRMNPRSLISG